MVERLGILGGTFNPIHVGHLRPALDVLHTLSLSRLLLMPCHLTSHRQQPGVSSETRARMVQLAADELQNVQLDRREIARGGLSYTVDSLRSLSAERPDAHLWFLLGTDSFATFTRWHRWREILTYANLAIMRRAGDTLGDHDEALYRQYQLSLAEAGGSRAGGMLLLDVAALRVSSTEIRRRLASGESVRYLVPGPVHEYLQQNRLYQGEQ